MLIGRAMTTMTTPAEPHLSPSPNRLARTVRRERNCRISHGLCRGWVRRFEAVEPLFFQRPILPGSSRHRHPRSMRPRRQVGVRTGMRRARFVRLRAFGGGKGIRVREFREPARAGGQRPLSGKAQSCCLDHRSHVCPGNVYRFRDVPRPSPHEYARRRGHRQSHARCALPRFTRPGSRPMPSATAKRPGSPVRLSLTLSNPQARQREFF